jgi:hypothetical protein
MLTCDRPKIVSFGGRLLILFSIAVTVFEIGTRMTGHGSVINGHYFVEVVSSFVGVYLAGVLIVSFFNGWIRFSK